MNKILQPSILLLGLPPDIQERWQQALNDIGPVKAVTSADAAIAEIGDARLDICIVDIDSSTENQDLAIVALRGVFSDTDFIGVGTKPNLQRLLSSVNEGQMRRFLTINASIDEIRALVNEIWTQRRTHRLMNLRLREVTAERDRLLVERDKLTQLLTGADQDLAVAAQKQRNVRAKTDALLKMEGLSSNQIPFLQFCSRVAEELERQVRYKHPVALLSIQLQFSIDDAEQIREMSGVVQHIISKAIRHIDMIASEIPGSISILLPVTPRERANIVCDRIRKALESTLLPISIKDITLSCYPEDRSAFVQLVGGQIHRIESQFRTSQ